eukprot:6205959-Pleurochrysis_carterae.AAC.1
MPSRYTPLHGKCTRRDAIPGSKSQHHDGGKMQSDNIHISEGDSYSCGGCARHVDADGNVYIGNVNSFCMSPYMLLCEECFNALDTLS